MQPSTRDTTEIRELPRALDASPPGLPAVPGGWTERAWTLGGRDFRLWLPAVPDAFLDDPRVMEAHERDEYMPYWAYLWPAALHLAEAVLQRPWPAGTRVVELGCGIGLVGLAALAAGFRVTFTDYDPLAVELSLANARRHGFTQATGEVVDWRSPPERSFPVILACELLYEDRNHEPLLELTRRWLEPNGVAWFGDGGRIRAERFCQLAPDYGLMHQAFDERGAPLPHLRVGRFQRIEVRPLTTHDSPLTPPHALP
jgi:predicted nicotinamide N-methyase